MLPCDCSEIDQITDSVKIRWEHWTQATCESGISAKWACGKAKAFKIYERFQLSIDQGFILFLGLTLISNEAFNSNGALGKMVSIRNIQDMWWYWIKRDGKMQKIVYCNPESYVFDERNSTCQSRLGIDGATLELMAVREEDRGLQLQCRIFPQFQVSRQVYKMKISVELPKG